MISFRSCLWFDGQALPAAEFYQKIFKDVKIGQIEKYGKEGQDIHGQPEGSIMTVEFSIGKQKFVGLNGGPIFKFNPTFSNYITCTSLEEIDRLWSELSSQGQVRMELAEQPWAKKYGWTADRFGVEWQIMHSENENEIVPAFLFVEELFGQGQKAIDFYTQHFKNSEILVKAMNPENNTIMFAQFDLGGQKFVLMEGPGEHGHVFNEAYSIMVECDTQEEIDYHWEGLSKGGSQGPCGWLKDPFGVSWQIAPAQVSEWLAKASPEQKDNFMKQMLQMKKLDIAPLKAAVTGAGKSAT